MIDRTDDRDRKLMGWVGALCLLLILPVKLLRVFGPTELTWVYGVLPSILGPPGLLLLILHEYGHRPGWTLARTSLFVGVLAVGLELIQLVPRPGVLARVSYTFDYLDLVASLSSLLVTHVWLSWRTRVR